jgi:hypothetical protein
VLGEWIPLVEAAERLGYSRSRIYALKDVLGAQPASGTGRLQVPAAAVTSFLESPPPGFRRPKRQPRGVPEAVERLVERVDHLAGRIAAMEIILDPGETSQSSEQVGQSALQWRRQALAARGSLVGLMHVGELYEKAMEAEDQAQELEAQAAAHRRRATRAVREALTAHRAALSAYAAPSDVGEIEV